MYDINDAYEDLDSWYASVRAQQADAMEMIDRVGALTATAESRDGSVRVTVDSAGHIQRLELADEIHQVSGTDLAGQIMMVIARAQAGLAPKVFDAVQATVGAYSRSGREMISSFEERFPEPVRGPGETGGR